MDGMCIYCYSWLDTYLFLYFEMKLGAGSITLNFTHKKIILSLDLLRKSAQKSYKARLNWITLNTVIKVSRFLLKNLQLFFPFKTKLNHNHGI